MHKFSSATKTSYVLSDRRYGLFVFELAESVGIRQGFHENIRELLLVFRRLVLGLPMLQQHVDLGNQQGFRVFKF